MTQCVPYVANHASHKDAHALWELDTEAPVGMATVRRSNRSSKKRAKDDDWRRQSLQDDANWLAVNRQPGAQRFKSLHDLRKTYRV